jgi:hypothetical protein
MTNGLRAILFFEQKPIAISPPQFLGRERLADHYRKRIDGGV